MGQRPDGAGQTSDANQIALNSYWGSSLGLQLFRKVGRQLELTDDGRLALVYAEQIFALDTEMESALRQEQGISGNFSRSRSCKQNRCKNFGLRLRA